MLDYVARYKFSYVCMYVVTFAVSLAVSEIQAGVMLKATYLYLPLNLKVMPLECGDEIWRQRIMGLPYG